MIPNVTILKVTTDDIENVENHGTVCVLTGTDHKNRHEQIVFAADWRNARDIVNYVREEGAADVIIQDWQIRGRRPLVSR